jgi:CRP-like cAMP-binding protein
MTRIAEKMRPVEVESGQVVAKKGDSCDVIWFVASGSLRCEVDGIEVQKLGPGQCIGEMSFISASVMVSSGTPLSEARATALRTADVIACQRTQLLELSFDDAWAVVHEVPNLYYTLKEVAEMKKKNCDRKMQWAAAGVSEEEEEEEEEDETTVAGVSDAYSPAAVLFDLSDEVIFFFIFLIHYVFI